MTENEAIKEFNKLIGQRMRTKQGISKKQHELFQIAMDALEEIQQYRALGTVEDFKNRINDVKTLSRMYEKLSDKEVKEYRELKAYKDIGTVEELREAREKRMTKMPYIWGDGYSDGHPVYDMYECPGCGEDYEIDGEKYDFCPNCGQALDWSEEKIIRQEEIEALKEILQENKDSEIQIARSFLEDIVKYFENQNKVGVWIPCSEWLPENAKHKGAFCPKYIVMTKYGETVGWYNPDFECWYVLIWFMTERFLTEEIDFERGDVPKIVRAPLEEKIVIAWQPLPAPYQSKEAKDGEKTE